MNKVMIFQCQNLLTKQSVITPLTHAWWIGSPNSTDNLENNSATRIWGYLLPIKSYWTIYSTTLFRATVHTLVSPIFSEIHTFVPLPTVSILLWIDWNLFTFFKPNWQHCSRFYPPDYFVFLFLLLLRHNNLRNCTLASASVLRFVFFFYIFFILYFLLRPPRLSPRKDNSIHAPVPTP